MGSELLSQRALVSRDREDFLSKYITICNSDPYHAQDNPHGYINFGTAVNNMCNDILHPRLHSVWSCDVSLLGYEDDFGTLRLREAMANLLTELLESHEPVSADNLFCLTGVTSCIDVLAHCLADAGEVFLAPAPMYGCMYRDFMYRSQVEVWPVNIITENDTEEHPELTMEKISTAYKEALAAGRCVRGLLLINPNNPTGDVYSAQLLEDILAFCNRKSLHLVVDELYAASVFSKQHTFHSVLKFPQLPDPQRVHVLYGLSKDFGLAGLRVGVVHTLCEPLQKCLVQLSALQAIPYPLMEITARFLQDLGWCREYVGLFRERLAEKYKYCREFLRKTDVRVRECHAGCFLWLDLRHLCSSFEEEWELFEHLLNGVKLYLNPGREFACAQPGWFRLVFIQAHLTPGLERLKEGLASYAQKRKARLGERFSS